MCLTLLAIKFQGVDLLAKYNESSSFQSVQVLRKHVCVQDTVMPRWRQCGEVLEAVCPAPSASDGHGQMPTKLLLPFFIRFFLPPFLPPSFPPSLPPPFLSLKHHSAWVFP